MMQNPLDLTQGDLSGLMEAGQTLANIPGVGGGSSPLGGVGELLNTVERVLKMASQFNDNVDRFGMTIAKFKGMDMPGMNQPVEGGFFPAGQVIEGGVYQPPERAVNIPSPAPEPQPEPAPTPTVDPVRIYSEALGWLASLPEEMTMKEALELARENKGMVLGAIEKVLPSLLGSEDGPGQ